MAEIGAAAAKGGSVPEPARAAMRVVAVRDVFRPEPFLVEGTVAETAGDSARAERLFAEARRRDPRSAAARYFLAERYLRTGRVGQGLTELAVLSRLVEGSHAQIIPALVAFAKQPGSTAELQRFFNAAPSYRDAVLSELAAEPDNAELIVALAKPGGEPATANWQGQIVGALVARGEYARAEAAWRKLSGAASRGLLYNPQFRPTGAAPPFNWSFPAGGAGLVEPASGGRLQVLYYGRENAVLASQLLLLAPGRYRLAMAIDGSGGDGALRWVVTCLPNNMVIARLPLANGSVAGDFAVPAGCAAQRLELAGSAGEGDRQAELAIGRLRLTKVGGQ
jgi:hypothetical protein